jgi:hypothetical protein
MCVYIQAGFFRLRLHGAMYFRGTSPTFMAVGLACPLCYGVPFLFFQEKIGGVVFMNKYRISNNLKYMLLVLLVFSLAGFNLNLEAETKYNFSYTFSGEMDLRSGLLSIWFFLEASASANFIVIKNSDGGQEFLLNSIKEAGYIARTRGLSKKSLKLFVADRDLKRAHGFAQKKWQQFIKNRDFYARVKKYREFPFLLPEYYEESIRFSRDKSGYYRDFENNLHLTYVDYEKDSYPYNNVYALMLEILDMYPPLPQGFPTSGSPGLKEFDSKTFLAEAKGWQSGPIFIDTSFNTITRLCSRSAGRKIQFTQEEGYRMSGQVSIGSDNIIQVTSYAYPGIKILKKVYIREFRRVVRIHLPSGTMLEDQLLVRLENDEGKGMKLKAALVLVEP